MKLTRPRTTCPPLKRRAEKVARVNLTSASFSPHSHRYRPLPNSSAAPECVAAVAPAVVVVIVIVFDATEMVAPLVVVVGSAECMMELQNQIKSPLSLTPRALFRRPWSVVRPPSPFPSCCFFLHCGCCCPCLLTPQSSRLSPPQPPPSPRRSLRVASHCSTAAAAADRDDRITG